MDLWARFVTPPKGVSCENRFSFSLPVWHLGRLTWITEDGGGVSESDERRLYGNAGVEEGGGSRFTEAKDLGGLNLDACESRVRKSRNESSRTDLGRLSG